MLPTSAMLKKRREKYTTPQIKFVCDYVAENHMRLFGQPASGCERVSKQRRECWDTLARQMAAIGCPGRSGSEMRILWSDLKKRAKKYEEDRNRTGGGEFVHKDTMEMVLASMRDTVRFGIKGEEAETGACQQHSQNSEACAILQGMSSDVNEIEEDVEETITNKPQKRKADNHFEYQERLLEIQQAMLKTQQETLDTFKEMLIVMKKFANTQEHYPSF
ncbi:uncharacterized protein [Diadema setosum]|uniref:uncharacterized protein isoform X2 n=1 Tax=Diadema setosum TaxID=31175 RepID=UPI003B3A668C